MKFALSATLLSLASLALSASVPPSQQCSQATRFGVASVSPNGTTLNADLFIQKISINVNFSCGIQQFNIVPKYLDYYLEVQEGNNGHQPPILLARREFKTGATSDSFTVKIPHGYFFPNAKNVVAIWNTYTTKGTDGSNVFVKGGVFVPININATV
ncbi:hypothetical protein DXG03_003762 [Asterophora parasitica]|uniref:Uncharacterized protein n=1 Tax=Asterophora parasitica TaxID=117018 RepID=A0A9P7G305_9AGAR|nr:hypothetical protein DXG03_003762 [Asterophora parasitica]